MSAVALDTSVIVAALLAWHEAHTCCAAAVARALDGDPVLPQSALIESYAVLTRLPAPHRLRPGDALEILEGSFRGRSRIASLRAASTWGLLSRARDEGVSGGLTYDARILAEARFADAGEILTLNPDDFLRLADDEIVIVDPSAPHG